MSEIMGGSTNLIRRGPFWHFCLRVPGDLVPAVGRRRVQFTLHTRDEGEARRRAVAHAEAYRKKFEAIRSSEGRPNATPVAGTRDTTGWRWADWEALAAWFEACLLDEDTMARLTGATGATLLDPATMPRRGHDFMVGTYELEERLQPMTMRDYARERSKHVQRYTGRIGIRLIAGPYFDRFMLACLQAEMRVIAKTRSREVGQRGYDHPHPDEIAGPWTLPSLRTAPELTAATRAGEAEPKESGYALSRCVEEWRSDKTRVGRNVTKHALAELEGTVALFRTHSGIDDIASVDRKSVIAFRNHLLTTGLATATVNKKVGHLLTLSKQANRSGWIDADLGGNYYLEAPAGEDHREPYTPEQLRVIFGHPLFTGSFRPSSRKALGVFSIWFPLISVLHGLSTLEAGQLGPDTIGPHPDHPEVPVFIVTTAGGRTVKARSRQRAVPIRRELLELGLMDLVEDAKQSGRRTIWREAEEVGWPQASNYFSAFWATFIKDELKLEVDDQSLYSLRHAFQDAVSASEWAPHVKYLMGHSHGGMTDRYGRKRGPRVVPIEKLDEAIQGLSWPWLSAVIRPN